MAPLQAEGKIEDLFWYFRARHNHWSFNVGSSPKEAIGGNRFWIGGEYKPKQEDAASYMSEEVGTKFIGFGIKCYKKWREMK